MAKVISVQHVVLNTSHLEGETRVKFFSTFCLVWFGLFVILKHKNIFFLAATLPTSLFHVDNLYLRYKYKYN